MKKLFTLALIVIMAQSAYAQNYNLDWGFGLGSTGNDAISDMTMDANGNVYVIGSNAATMDLDPGPATVWAINNSAGGQNNIFVAKYSLSGGLIWSKSLGDWNWDSGDAIEVDQLGHVYIGGTFLETLTIDAISVTNLGGGNQDAFLAQLDANTGACNWLKQIGNTTNVEGIAKIAVNTNNEIIVSGNFTGTVDMNPNAGVSNLTSGGGNDVYLTKFDVNGNFIWTKGISSTGADAPTCLIADANNNLYLSGYFSGTVDVDPSANLNMLSSLGGTDGILIKLNDAGDYQWHFRLGSAWSDALNSVAVDGSGNVFTVGYARISASNINAWFGKFNSSGVYQVGYSLGAAGTQSLTSVVTHNNNVYISGYYTGVFDVDPGPNVINSSYDNGIDSYILTFDNNLTYLSHCSFTNTADAYVNTLEYKNNTLYMCGNYSGTMDLDPESGTLNSTAVGNNDFFFAKYVSNIALPLQWLSFNVHDEKKYISLNWETSQEENTSHFEIERSFDAITFTKIGEVKAENSRGRNQYHLNDDQNIVNDKVYYRIKQVDADGKFTYSSTQKVIRSTNSGVSIYPNPANQFIYIKLESEEPSIVSIYSAHGQLLKQWNILHSDKLSISDLKAGIYFVRVTNSIRSNGYTFEKR
ncbi:MAG: T9SS type A sorting domain-containing protein [Chitinophagaceae bacterium]|nr:T9SS type A sorting domain-containing protein [Chitinophagaceae bacterium]